MTILLSVLLATVFTISTTLVAAAPAPQSLPTPTPTPFGIATPSTVEVLSGAMVGIPTSGILNAAQVKVLRSRFAKAQAIELYALEHRQQTELKELVASHKARRTEWEKREKALRHEMYAKNVPSKEMGQFIRDFVKRRKEFLKTLSDEKESRSKEYSVRSKSLRKSQTDARKEFEQYLSKWQTPPLSLWPSGS